MTAQESHLPAMSVFADSYREYIAPTARPPIINPAVTIGSSKERRGTGPRLATRPGPTRQEGCLTQHHDSNPQPIGELGVSLGNVLHVGVRRESEERHRNREDHQDQQI